MRDWYTNRTKDREKKYIQRNRDRLHVHKKKGGGGEMLLMLIMLILLDKFILQFL